MTRWEDARSWVGDGLRREVLFFPSGGVQLYGSLYQAAPITRPVGLLVCPSWGVEADRSSGLAHGLALAMARLGGAGFVFHCPGHGDSHGDLADATMDRLAAAAADAAAVASRRSPGLEWVISGFTFGASIASLAHRASGAQALLLLQPALRPGAYFRDLARSAERSALGSGAAGVAYGYPMPERILRDSAGSDTEVAEALAGLQGDGAVVRYASPKLAEPVPRRFEHITVEGTWRFGSRNQPELREAALGWLRSRSGADGRASESAGTAERSLP